MKHILVVDDEPTQRLLLQATLEKAGFTVETADDGRGAIDRLMAKGRGAVDCVFLDLSMPGTDGLDVIRQVRPANPDLTIVVLTAHGGVKTAVEAMRAGASDFLVKPASEERLVEAAQSATPAVPFDGQFDTLPVEADEGFGAIIGTAPAMRQATRLARKAASVSLPVLIDGESGVGKELFAQAIHSLSERSAKPFVAVNCGAIPDRLVESILFGHERGAFTGATERHTGKFQEADGGTLFLDEVGELPQDIQVKLLRALQEREVEPVGARRPVPVDIRLISATNRALDDMVAGGRFREDLYYRLNVFPLTLPPLRERQSDIPLLVEECINRVCRSETLPKKAVSDDAMRELTAFPWPGNVRQLQNVVYRAVVLSDDDVLTPDDFPHMAGRRGESPPVAETRTETPAAEAAAERQEADSASPPSAPPEDMVALMQGEGHIRPLEEIEAEVIRRAIALYNGRMSEVARRLGIGRSTLYRKLQDLEQERG